MQYTTRNFDSGSLLVNDIMLPIGEAAGIAAVMAIEQGIAPSDLDGIKVQARVDAFRS